MYVVKRKDGTFREVNLLSDIEENEFQESEVYACVRIYKNDFEAEIRDEISLALKNGEKTRKELIECVAQSNTDFPKSKIPKVITKMIKEGSLFYVEGTYAWDGTKLIGISE